VVLNENDHEVIRKKGMGKSGHGIFILRYHPCICLERLSKTTKDILCPSEFEVDTS
jgi:hypothetical protein